MSRMNKSTKIEMAFFLNERGRIQYCDLCSRCRKECKQSFKILGIYCPKFDRKEGR